jgi:MarR family transcriptional regulator, temperature-dependent positive regulator of motility
LKKRLGMLMGLALLFTVTGTGVASAAYDPAGDQTINITVPSQVNFPLNADTAQKSFDLQQGIHQQILDKTGKDITYSYIWITVNGTPVLAVDPPSGMW